MKHAFTSELNRAYDSGACLCETRDVSNSRWCLYRVLDTSAWSDDSYLVDPASSHMLVSKIKPCMSKYKHLYCETANGSLNQLSFI